MKLNKKIGVVGFGNMGQAILEGILRKEIAKPQDVVIFDVDDAKGEMFKKTYDVSLVQSAADVARETDLLLLAVKPQDFSSVSETLQKELRSGQTVISILAGVTLARLKEQLGDKVALVRAMPNLGARVGESITAVASADKSALKLAEVFFEGCGEVILEEERYFDLITAVSGSGPAYFFYLMERLVEEMKSQGMESGHARTLALQTALGSALLALQSDTEAGELRKMVTSKGGTTEAALKVFKGHSFEKMVHEAVMAAKKRGQELSGK